MNMSYRYSPTFFTILLFRHSLCHIGLNNQIFKK